MLKILRSIFLVTIFGILSGCFDYKEEIKVNADGSGNINIKIGFDDELSEIMRPASSEKGKSTDIAELMLPSKDIESWLKDKPGIKILNERLYIENGLHWKEVNISFDKIENLSELTDSLSRSSDASKNGSLQLLGSIAINKVSGKITYKRKITKSEEKNDPDSLFSENDTAIMLKGIFDGHSAAYSIIIPAKVESSNAKTLVEDAYGNTKLTWEFPLYDITQHDLEMQVTASPNSSIIGNIKKYNFSYLIAIFIGFLFVFGFFSIMKSRKKKSVAV